MDNVVCPYCNNNAEYVDSSEVYGKSFGMIYLCRSCNAYVGTHKNTSKPLGSLADPYLRYLRKQAHSVVDPLWKTGKMSRSQVYKLIQREMCMTSEEAHIGMMDEDQCKKLINKFYWRF